MKLTELLNAIGDDNIQMQNLDTSADTLDFHHKKGTKITFGTEMILTPTGTERLGLVIWLDRDQVKRFMDSRND